MWWGLRLPFPLPLKTQEPKHHCLMQGQHSQVSCILLSVLIEMGLNEKRSEGVAVVVVVKVPSQGDFPATPIFLFRTLACF